MPPKSSALPYSVDERIFCFHMDMLYEARIIDVKTGADANATRYRVHYKGWKNTWDDWVPADRIRKFNDENKDLAQQLREQFRQLQQQKSTGRGTKKTGAGAGSAPGDRGTSSTPGPQGAAAGATHDHRTGGRDHHGHDRLRDGGSELPSARVSEERAGGSSMSHARGRQRQRDFDLEQEDAFHNRPSIRLPMPDHLKAMLVDDWENVTKNGQTVPVPHEKPVETILEDYMAFEKPHREVGSPSLDMLEETVAGLREYFDKCLGRILLYESEREQYLEMHELWQAGGKHKTPGDTYGVEHLCRLLVSLPELVAQTNMDQQSVNRLREELTLFTSWLGRNYTKYFVSEYETPKREAS